jgi:hypothetical protein
MDTASVVPTDWRGSSLKNDNAKKHAKQQAEDPVSQPQYAYVKAVLLYEGDSDRLGSRIKETEELERFFKSLNFETEIFPIPTSNCASAVRKFIIQQCKLLR